MSMLIRKLKKPKISTRIKVSVATVKCSVVTMLYSSFIIAYLGFRRYVKIVQQHVGKRDKNRLSCPRSRIRADVRLDNVYHNNILRVVAADKAHVRAVELVVVIAAARFCYLGSAGFATHVVLTGKM